MKLVVFGATGNVGRRVVPEALRRGHEVVGVVRDPGAVASPDPRARLARGDATRPESVAAVVRGAEAVEGREALHAWRGEAEGLDWTFLCLAIEIGAGERTGAYRISFEDYAVAVLDELEQPRHVGRRFGVAY